MKDVYMQKCNGCNKEFPIQYLPKGNYRYIGVPCDCEDSFSPANSQIPSISKWNETQSQ